MAGYDALEKHGGCLNATSTERDLGYFGRLRNHLSVRQMLDTFNPITGPVAGFVMSREFKVLELRRSKTPLLG